MPVIRMTGFFRDDDGHGWSEQHDVDGGASVATLTPFLTAFDNVMKKFRRPLLAADGYYLGCRAAYRVDIKSPIAASNLLADVPIQGTQTTQGTETFMNSASDAVKVRIQNAASTANSDIYLRGVWDVVMQGGQLFFGPGPGEVYKRRLTEYVDALKAGAYGWQGINPAATPRGNVTNYAVNVDGTITFTVVVTNGVAMPAADTRAVVKIRRLNHSKSILNRDIVCNVVGPTTLRTLQVIAASDFESAGTFILPVKGFIPYDHVAYYKLSRRKTGRPFGVERGRRSAQVLS